MAIYLGNTLLTGPSGGTAASLTADQTFTGVNTFNNAAGIQAESIVGASGMTLSANGTQFLEINDSLGIELLNIESNLTRIRGTQGVSLNLIDGNDNIMSGFETNTTFNGTNQDRDFIVNGTLGNAGVINYDAGTDTLTGNAGSYAGIADQEAGTWTPTFNNTGTYTLASASYERAGGLVHIAMLALIGTGTTTNDLRLDVSSLPFVPSTAIAYGTYLEGASGVTTPGTFLLTTTSSSFVKPDGTRIQDDEVTGSTSITITYQTA